MPARASIVDVARTANVSVATVSRVMNSSAHPVSEETRLRVQAAAAALQYSPSALAKAMVTRDTRIVGVIIGDAADPYFAGILRGVEDVARQNGYLVIICNSDRQPEVELRYLHTLNDYRVEGVIFAGGGLLDEDYVLAVQQALEVYSERDAVCVSLGKHLFSSFSVVVDNSRIVADGVEYLLSLGHRAIAYISGPSLLTTTQLRQSGYENALQAHGIALRPDYVLAGDYTYEAGRTAAYTLAALPERPTAVMASNDLMAIGCLAGLKALGLRVPADISVMGIDDVATAEFVDPPLTTIALPLQGMGAAGMESLIRLRRAELAPTGSVTLPHQLVIRQVHGRAPAEQFAALNCASQFAAGRPAFSADGAASETHMQFGFIPTEGGPYFQEALAEAIYGEELGFASVWLEEHHGIRNHYWPSPLMALAGIATRTSRILLGTDIVVMPFYHPVRAAEDVALLDIMSGGRAILGAAIGYRPDEFTLYDVSLDNRGARYVEQLALMRALWTQEQVDFKGKFYTVSGRIEPRPPVAPKLWLGGWGELSLKRAAQLGDAWVPGPTAQLDKLLAAQAQYRDCLRAIGKDPAAYPDPLTREVIIADTTERAWELAEQHLLINYRDEYGGGAWQHPLIGSQDHTPVDQLEALSRDRFIVGNPEDCIRKLQRFEETFGVDHLICRLYFPGMPHEHIMHELKLLATEVMPAFAKTATPS